MATRRGKDLRLRYDQDRGGQWIVVQRTYRDSVNGQLTPITPLLQARVVDGLPIEVTRVRPRRCICCLPNPGNASGESNMTVIVPYLPASAEQEAHLNELVNYDNGFYSVEAVTYFSEGLDSGG